VQYEGQHIITGAAKRLDVPLNEIWISQMWRPYRKYVLFHELREIRYRAKGFDPEDAHKQACKDDMAEWKNDSLWQRMVAEIENMDRKTVNMKKTKKQSSK
jgi:competence protein ComEA